MTNDKISEFNNVVKKFFRTNRMWETGYGLDYITSELAKVLENTKVCINLPYATFNCHGCANIVAEDVKGLMPFSKNPKSEDECTTLFYGSSKIHRGNYIPFLSSSDRFHVKNVEFDDNVINIWLEKGNNANMFM